MAALTWREVSAPSFGSSNSVLRDGLALQQGALSSIGDALARFREDRAANVDSQVMARALQVNDPAAYQKALSDGSLLSGVDPAQITPRTLAALGARQGELLSQAGTRANTEARVYNNNRTQTLDQIADAARGQTAERLGLTGALAQLSPQEQLQIRQGETALTGGQLNNDARRFSNMTTQRDDGVNQVGINIADGILRRSASATDALAELEGMTDAQPSEREAARAIIERTFGSLYNPAGAAAPGGRGGKPGTAAGSPFDTTFNFQGTAAPISSQPIGKVLDVQTQSQQSQGHSPMGAFQINKATLEDYGPKVLGKDWKSQEFTPEVQEKIAKAIFEDRKGGDLTKTWSSLGNTSPGAYKDTSWESMRNIISRGEVGQNLPNDPASLRLLSQAGQFETNRRVAQNNSVGVTADVERNLNETRSAPELVTEAVKTQFPGADQGKLLGIVNKIQRDNPNLSAADALSAVSRSARDSAWYTPGTTTFGDGIGVDDSVLETNVQSLKEGKADYQSQANQLTRAQGQKLATAQQSYDTALQNLMQLSARKEIQPGIDTARAQAAFDKAEAALKKVLGTQQNSPNYRPVR